MPDEKKEKIERIVVVSELPTQQVNKAETNEGEPITLITIEQALTEIREDIKAIRKAVA